MRFKVLLLLSLLVISCSENRNEKNSFESIHYINRIDLSRNLLRPNMFCVIDSVILLYDNASNEDTLFYAFNINTGKKYSKFGIIGSGPTDYNFPVQMSYNDKKNEIDVFDQAYSKQYSYKLEDIINNNIGNPSLVNSPIETSRFILENDSIGWSLGSFLSGEMLGKSINDDLIETYFEFPEVKGLSQNQRFSLFQGNIIFNHNINKLVYTSNRCDLIKIFSIKNNLITEIATRNTYLPKFKAHDGSYPSILSESLNGYISVSITDKYIYALLSGRSEKEHGDKNYFGNTIHMFDWDGVLNKEISLNKDAWQVYVEEKSNKMYTIHFDFNESEYNQVQYFEYELPK